MKNLKYFELKIISETVRTCTVSIIVIGNISSTAPMSFENLFKILPCGLVLKNLIVAYTILSNMLLCRLVEAVIQYLKNDTDLVSVSNTARHTREL